MRTRLALLLVVIVAACSPPARGPDLGAPSSEPPTSGAATTAPGAGTPNCDALFAPPADAPLLCTEHVLGNNMEISWRSWTSTASSKDVFEPYRQKLAACPEAKETKPRHVALGPARLMVYDVGESYPTCEAKAPAGAKTIVIVSYGYPR